MNERELPRRIVRPHTRVAGPLELPPDAKLTNDCRLWEERSRPAMDWEIEEAARENLNP